MADGINDDGRAFPDGNPFAPEVLQWWATFDAEVLDVFASGRKPNPGQQAHAMFLLAGLLRRVAKSLRLWRKLPTRKKLLEAAANPDAHAPIDRYMVDSSCLVHWGRQFEESKEHSLILASCVKKWPRLSTAILEELFLIDYVSPKIVTSINYVARRLLRQADRTSYDRLLRLAARIDACLALIDGEKAVRRTCNEKRDRRIYDLYLEGKGPKEILDLINSEFDGDLTSSQAINNALNRYCARNKIQKPRRET